VKVNGPLLEVNVMPRDGARLTDPSAGGRKECNEFGEALSNGLQLHRERGEHLSNSTAESARGRDREVPLVRRRSRQGLLLSASCRVESVHVVARGSGARFAVMIPS
jgi:hypothetical protein